VQDFLLQGGLRCFAVGLTYLWRVYAFNADFARDGLFGFSHAILAAADLGFYPQRVAIADAGHFAFPLAGFKPFAVRWQAEA